MITTINEFKLTLEQYVSTKDQLKQIAKDIKNKFKDFKFSIRVTHNTIDIAILSAPIELRLDPTKDYNSVNHFWIKSNYKDMPDAQKILQEITDIALSNNREITYDGDYGSIPNYYVY